MFKKLGERLNKLNRDMEDIKKIKIECLGVKATTFWIKNIQSKINEYQKLLKKRLGKLKTLQYKLCKMKYTEKND